MSYRSPFVSKGDREIDMTAGCRSAAWVVDLRLVGRHGRARWKSRRHLGGDATGLGKPGSGLAIRLRVEQLDRRLDPVDVQHELVALDLLHRPAAERLTFGHAPAGGSLFDE